MSHARSSHNLHSYRFENLKSLVYQLVKLVPFETNHLTCTAQAPPDIYFVGTQSIWHQWFEKHLVIVALLVNNTIGINWMGRANAPQYIAYLRIVFGLLSWNWGERRGKGCVFIKDWIKPFFPLFLTRLLPKVSNTHGRFLKWTLERIWKEMVEPDFIYCPGMCLEENCVNLIQGSQFPQPGFEPIILQLWIRVADEFRIKRRKSHTVQLSGGQMSVLSLVLWIWYWHFLFICFYLFVCLFLFICLFICLSIYLSICLSLYLYVYLSSYSSVRPSVRLSIHPSIHLSIYLSICLSVCLSIYLSIYLSVYLSICICLSLYLSIHPSVRPSVRLSVCLTIYLSVCLSDCLSIYLSVCLCIYLFIYCNWVSSWWQWLVDLYKNRKQTTQKEKQYTKQYKKHRIHKI